MPATTHPPSAHELYALFQRVDSRSFEVYERVGQLLRHHTEREEAFKLLIVEIRAIRTEINDLRTDIGDMRGETREKLASVPDLQEVEGIAKNVAEKSARHVFERGELDKYRKREKKDEDATRWFKRKIWGRVIDIVVTAVTTGTIAFVAHALLSKGH